MQFNSVYLYTNKLDVFTIPTDVWSTERYRKVYNHNLKIFRGVDNRIDIQVRNPDQKSSNITGSTLVFNLVSEDTKDLVLTKDFQAMDVLTGKVTITLTDRELLDLDNGAYSYSIIKEVRSIVDSTDYQVISKMPLYMDSQYGATGVLEVSGDVYGVVAESIVVDTFNYTNPFTQGELIPAWFESSIIDANPTINSGNALHTFQFYSTNYSGSVTIQGSLDYQGATPRQDKWVNVATVDLTTESYKNVTGHWNWFRIKHIPSTNSASAQFVVSQTTLLNYSVGLYNGGIGYQVGDIILIPGNRLGGGLGTNDLTITVTGISGFGKITAFTTSGISYNGVKTFVVSGTTNDFGSLDKILYR
jgi:hypothetical protein